MASPEWGLADLQSWMQRAVLDIRDGATADWSGGTESQILPSPSLTPAERLQIYRGMYPLRMVEALESDYPALAHFLGAAGFRDLVCAYVSEHPSRSYTLNRLGDHLPEFVAGHRGIRRRAFASDLASFERAIAQVLDAEESPLLDPERVIAAGERAAEGRLRTIEAFRLLAFRYPVNAYLQSVRDDEHEHPPTKARRTWVAVYRRHYTVRRLDLSRDQHALLSALISGATLGDALAKTVQSARGRVGPDDFFVWFRDWVAAGMFQALDL